MAAQGTGTPDRTTGSTGWKLGAQYLGAAAAWSASFLFIKVAVTGMGPGQLVVGRLTAGAVTLAAIMLVTRRRWPRGLEVWLHLTGIGAVMCVFPFLLFSWAAERLPSSLSSIYNGTTPIMTMLVALAFLPEERLTRAKLSAFLVAAAGVVLVAAPWNAMDSSHGDLLLAGLACLGGTVCYGFGFVLTRRFQRTSPYDALTVTASQIGAGALLSIALSPVIASGPLSITPAVAASTIVLGAIGTGIAYVWYANVINAWGATIASTVTYLTPLGGVLLGTVFLAETVTVREIAGGLVVVLAVLVSQGRLRVPSRNSAPTDRRTTRPDRTAPTRPPVSSAISRAPWGP